MLEAAILAAAQAAGIHSTASTISGSSGCPSKLGNRVKCGIGCADPATALRPIASDSAGQSSHESWKGCTVSLMPASTATRAPSLPLRRKLPVSTKPASGSGSHRTSLHHRFQSRSEIASVSAVIVLPRREAS